MSAVERLRLSVLQIGELLASPSPPTPEGGAIVTATVPLDGQAPLADTV